MRSIESEQKGDPSRGFADKLYSATMISRDGRKIPRVVGGRAKVTCR